MIWTQEYKKNFVSHKTAHINIKFFSQLLFIYSSVQVYQAAGKKLWHDVYLSLELLIYLSLDGAKRHAQKQKKTILFVNKIV